MIDDLPIVVVDDEQNALLSIECTLLSFKYKNIVTCNNKETMWNCLKEKGAKLILLDLIMPDANGEDVLVELKSRYPDIPVIITTGINELNTAVQCMKKGAIDYIPKPVDSDRLRISVKNAIKILELEKNRDILSGLIFQKGLKNPEPFKSIITVDRNMKSIFQYIEAVASSEQAFLITGETGTGKELFAKAIHDASKMAGDFIAVNVAGVDDTVFADTLFGHEIGAYTGAESKRDGLVKQASGGTLFLDEIGDLTTLSQLKLLRLLQENEYHRLGSDKVFSSNARIIAATSKTISELEYSKTFRKDLFYRLRTHHINIPPLRERKCDLAILVQHFLNSAAKKMGKTVPTPPEQLYTLLSTWNFPGNIRELEGIIYDAVAHHSGKILSMERINNALKHNSSKLPTINSDPLSSNNIYSQCEILPTFKEAEKSLLKEALNRSNGNQSIAAGLLGISRQAISQRLKKM